MPTFQSDSGIVVYYVLTATQELEPKYSKDRVTRWTIEVKRELKREGEKYNEGKEGGSVRRNEERARGFSGKRKRSS